KVMHAIQRNAMDTGISFKGSNETAETYFPESFKGTRLDPAMKRASRKRGSKAKRLVSAEDVCVCAVIGAENSCYAASVNKSFPSEADMEKVYGGRLAKDAVLLCRDERYAFLQKYCVVSRVAEVEKVSGLHGYMRMRVNAISHGVATKYLNRYMAAFSAAYGKDASAAASKVFSVITDRNGMFASNMDLRTKDLLVF
ncbi:MAG: hypothetical protein LUE27_01685, partial [Clostridia bacterium]|nr:hypothetical protein [Clostridia bacterium]